MGLASDFVKVRRSIIYNRNVEKDIRIASFGDVHLSFLAGLDDIFQISDVLYQLRPDYICALGDLIDNPLVLYSDRKVDELRILMRNIASIAPSMVVLGNHDFVDEDLVNFSNIKQVLSFWDGFDQIPNLFVLNDKTYFDQRIFIGGYRQKPEAYYNLVYKRIEDSMAYYEDFKNYDFLYKNIPSNYPKILLTHSPDPLENSLVQDLTKEYDVIITGHYHNGCVPSMLEDVMPQHLGLISPRKKLFPKYARGVVQLDTGSYLIYNGGWTKLAECTPRVLHPLNALCNKQVDFTILTADDRYQNMQVSNQRVLLRKKS